MKKVFSLILTLCLVFSMAGCVSQSDLDAVAAERDAAAAERDALKATVEKYSAIIDALEAEDYEAAIDHVAERIPAPPEPEYAEVKITMENWQDYFEIRPYEDISKNAFGEVETMSYGSCGIYLKDEFLPLLKENDDSAVDVLFKASVASEMREFDIENAQFVENGRVKDNVFGPDPSRPNNIRIIDYRNYEDTDLYHSTAYGQVCGLCGGDSMTMDDVYYCEWYLSFDVIDVTGTMMLAK